jgi:aryl-alcohol dehydrogenase-like predicted oxidoreductase
VASAIVGASRPDQIIENAKAADVVLDGSVMKKIDEILSEVIEKDPAKIVSPNPRA